MVDVEFGCLEEKGSKMASAGEDTWPLSSFRFRTVIIIMLNPGSHIKDLLYSL